MKLNTNTQNILKNFSEINTNILIKPGKELSTISLSWTMGTHGCHLIMGPMFFVLRPRKKKIN